MQIPKEKGQSLVEVVVSLAVVLLVILALVRVTVTSMRNASFARNQALATQYAQEGIENARTLRDQDPGAFFSGSCPASGQIGIFYKTITCAPDNGDEKRKVTVTVTWPEGSTTHESKLTTYLTKWE